MQPLIAILRRLWAPWFGEGAASSLRSLDIAPADFAKLGMSLGHSYETQWPSYPGYPQGAPVTFKCIRARSALVDGGLVKAYAGNAGRTAAVTGAKKGIIPTAGTFAAADVVGALMELVSGTGANQTPRVILGSDGAAGASKLKISRRDSQLRLDEESASDALGTATDATTNVSIFAGWECVSAGGAATDQVSGVALGAVTSGNYSIIVESGYAHARVDGGQVGRGGTALCGLVPGAADTAWPVTAAGVTAPDAAFMFGTLIHAYTGAAAKRLIRLHGRFKL